MQCEFCKTTIAEGALICPQCRKSTPEGKAASPGRFFARLGLCLLGLCGVAVLLMGLISQKVPTPNGASATAWSYSRYDDPMRGSTSYRAELKNDGVPLKLVLWKNPDGTANAYIESEESLDSCEILIGEPIAAKFDDDPVANISCSQGADESTTLFVEKGEDFISRLKTAKRLTLELKLRQGPRQQFTLDVAGLKWPPLSSDEKPA